MGDKWSCWALIGPLLRVYSSLIRRSSVLGSSEPGRAGRRRPRGEGAAGGGGAGPGQHLPERGHDGRHQLWPLTGTVTELSVDVN